MLKISAVYGNHNTNLLNLIPEHFISIRKISMDHQIFLNALCDDLDHKKDIMKVSQRYIIN